MADQFHGSQRNQRTDEENRQRRHGETGGHADEQKKSERKFANTRRKYKVDVGECLPPGQGHKVERMLLQECNGQGGIQQFVVDRQHGERKAHADSHQGQRKVGEAFGIKVQRAEQLPIQPAHTGAHQDQRDGQSPKLKQVVSHKGTGKHTAASSKAARISTPGTVKETWVISNSPTRICAI